jgi:hypothetical protein
VVSSTLRSHQIRVKVLEEEYFLVQGLMSTGTNVQVVLNPEKDPTARLLILNFLKQWVVSSILRSHRIRVKVLEEEHFLVQGLMLLRANALTY